MGRISPPFLEIQMYYRDQNENEKFLDVLNVLLNRGAILEKMLVVSFSEIVNMTFYFLH
jgi:hypothetical protein